MAIDNNVRLLLVEDSDDDAALIVRRLRRGGIDVEYERVDTASAMRDSLYRRRPDLVISDNGMPAFNAKSALTLLRQHEAEVPFIVVSGQIGDEPAAALMREGAQDFVLKGNLTRLVPAVQRELYEAGQRAERHRVEAVLHTTEERFRLVAEHLRDIVFRYRVAPDPALEYISPSVISITGRDPVELYRDVNLLFAAVEPEDRAAFVQSWQTPLPHPMVVRWRPAEDQPMWTEQRAVAIRDERGRLVAVEGILRDTTEQMRMEEERQQLERQLHQVERLDSLGRLAGGIAHDFNNLLGIIVGFANLALDALPPDHPVRDDIEGISQAAQQSAALTRQLLIFSRRQPSRPAALDVNAVVADTEKLLRRALGHDIELVTSLAPDVDFILIDHSRLEQIILNLVMNSRAAMPNGGRLTVETAMADGVANAPDLAPGRYVRLTVTDTGCGMEPHVASRAFEPFFTTKGGGQGSGLGLATVYGAAKEASGSVTLWSEVGKGTRISIYLPSAGPRTITSSSPADPGSPPQPWPPAEPRSPPQPGSPPQPWPPSQPWSSQPWPPSQPWPSDGPAAPAAGPEPVEDTAGGEHILIVEDDDAVRKTVRRTLTEAGYQLSEASTRRDAVSLLQAASERLDLVLAAVVMPGMTAGEFMDTIRRLRPDLPVVLISGPAAGKPATPRPVPIALSLVAKPVDSGTLLVDIRAALDQARGFGRR